MRTTWTFYSAAELIFGMNAAAELGEAARRQALRRVFVVTDPVVLAAGCLEPVQASLEEAGLALDVFTGGAPEPSLQVAQAAIDAGRSFGPDAVLGLGGGSNLDLSKIVAVVLQHGGVPRDYVGENRIPGPVLPLICVPTTAGTGSEVSAATVLTDTEQQVKVGILSNFLRPRIALVDPLLTLSCPPKPTADSGIDALTHAIEAYTAIDNARFPLPAGERSVYQGHTPFGDMVAERAIELVGRFLRRAVRDGQDREAREGMALAATLGGLAFSNVGVAAVHALEYPVGGAVHCSHGAGNGLLLPFVMRFNKPACTARMARVAALLGEDVRGLGDDEAADRAIVAVEKLRADIGIPPRLRDIGVKEEQLRGFAEKAIKIQRVLRVNPRPTTVDDLEGILRSAW